eukprot:CAMPEP_0205813654 /NCGR_PEP_ID=MMETSP0205-20121125/18365_1 /ASSEMBLY_ACC=CAM_ASM_000278 /TAXON_ID=36767 /ORGANISM="Euplotes focardii, Strain TN1" /LENGTH=223 /DNA_ID=CAMNT_0053096063 /DNA_START=1 /DNA_END=669 /DNA_ORIENTATION=+
MLTTTPQISDSPQVSDSNSNKSTEEVQNYVDSLKNDFFNFTPTTNVFMDYCFCETFFMPFYDPMMMQDYSTMMAQQQNMSTADSFKTSKTVRKRKRKNNLPQIEAHIKEVSRLVAEGTLVYLQNTPKNINALTIDNCRRRSQYTGVSRNGRNWQVLVNMGKEKKYIGSYTSEKEAALSYDFYTICLHKMKAKTNFSYTNTLIEHMIENFYSSGNVFDPTQFIN